MLFDGTLVFVTENGFIGTVKGSKSRGFWNSTPLINLSPDDDVVHVSNSMACDEEGGIYIVSDRLGRIY